MTPYKNNYCAKVIQFFDSYRSSGGAGPFPTLKGFASLHCGVPISTLDHWREVNPKFNDACEVALGLQESFLVDKGLTGEFKSPIAKMLLAQHGYTDSVTTYNDGESNPLDVRENWGQVVEELTKKMNELEEQEVNAQ